MHHYGKEMKCKHVDAQTYAHGVMASISVAHDQVNQHIFDI